MIKYEHYNSFSGSSGSGSDALKEDNNYNWWELELMPFHKFSNNIEKVMELVEFIKTLYTSTEQQQQQQYKFTIDKLSSLLFPSWFEANKNTYIFNFPNYLNSFSNVFKLYEIFKQIKLFINCINEITSNIDTTAMKFIVDQMNSININENDQDLENNYIIKKFANNCLNGFDSLYTSNSNQSKITPANLKDDEKDESIIEFIETVLDIKVFSVNSNNSIYYSYLPNVIKVIGSLLIKSHNSIKLINLIKSIFFTDKETEIFLQILSDTIVKNTKHFVNKDFSFIQLLYQEFPNCFNYRVSFSVLNCYYYKQLQLQQEQQEQKEQKDDGTTGSDIGCNHPFFRMLINNLKSYYRASGNELIKVLQKLLKIGELPFLKFIVNQLKEEIQECKLIVSDEFYFKSNDIASWFMDNCGHLVSVNILEKLIDRYSILNNHFHFELVEIIYNYFKSKNLEIPKQEWKISFHYLGGVTGDTCKLLDHLTKEKSITSFRFYIQAYNYLNIDFGFKEIPLFNELLLSSDNNNNIDNDNILKLIDNIIYNIKEKEKEKERKRKRKIEEREHNIKKHMISHDYFQELQQKPPPPQHQQQQPKEKLFVLSRINQILQQNINNNEINKLVKMGELKLAIKLYSNLKSKQPQYNKAYNDSNENNVEPYNKYENDGHDDDDYYYDYYYDTLGDEGIVQEDNRITLQFYDFNFNYKYFNDSNGYEELNDYHDY